MTPLCWAGFSRAGSQWVGGKWRLQLTWTVQVAIVRSQVLTHLRSWTHKQDQNGVETAKICKEKLAERAGGPFNSFDAADCSGFIVRRI